MEELKNIIFCMDSESAPSLDDFFGAFYKNCKNIIVADLLAAVCHFFRTGWVPPSVNLTLSLLFLSRKTLLSF